MKYLLVFGLGVFVGATLLFVFCACRVSSECSRQEEAMEKGVSK